MPRALRSEYPAPGMNRSIVPAAATAAAAATTAAAAAAFEPEINYASRIDTEQDMCMSVCFCVSPRRTRSNIFLTGKKCVYKKKKVIKI